MTFIRPVTPVSSDPVPDGSVTNAKVSATAAISADKLADGTNAKVFTAAEKTKLATGVIGTAVGNVVSFIGASAQWTRVNIINDPSSEAGWADRMAFYFDTDNNGVAETRTGYFNEYGEVRARPAKTNTVALRALGHANISSGDIFQVSSATQDAVYFGVAIAGITCNVPLTLTGTNTITAPNLTVIAANNQTGTSYTLVLGDAGKCVECDNASAITLTIPPNASVAFPIGTVLEVFQQGAGQVTVTPGSGVTLRAPDGAKLAKQYASASLRKRATNEWVLAGNTTT